MNHSASQETLELILKSLCVTVEFRESTGLQTLYHLADNIGAKLAYDLLISYSFSAKLYADVDTSRLYVENSGLTAEKLPILQEILAQTDIVKSIKATLDNDPKARNYQINVQNGSTGHQITIQFPSEKIAYAPTPAPSIPKSPTPPPTSNKQMKRKAKIGVEDDVLSAGPAVKRKALPKSLTPDGQNEDGALKRALLFGSSHALLFGSTIVLFFMFLALIFGSLTLIRSYVCYDVASLKNPEWYCRNAPPPPNKETLPADVPE